jgi:hypothetical protein
MEFNVFHDVYQLICDEEVSMTRLALPPVITLQDFFPKNVSFFINQNSGFHPWLEMLLDKTSSFDVGLA